MAEVTPCSEEEGQTSHTTLTLPSLGALPPLTQHTPTHGRLVLLSVVWCAMQETLLGLVCKI